MRIEIRLFSEFFSVSGLLCSNLGDLQNMAYKIGNDQRAIRKTQKNSYYVVLNKIINA